MPAETFRILIDATTKQLPQGVEPVTKWLTLEAEPTPSPKCQELRLCKSLVTLQLIFSAEALINRVPF